MTFTRKYESSAGAVVVHPDRKRILMVRSTVGRKGWGFPKGHIMRNERPATTARREVKEETGLSTRGLAAIAQLKSVRQLIRYPQSREIVVRETQFFLLTSASQAIQSTPTDGQHDQAAWITFAKLSGLRLRYSYVKELANEARRLLKQTAAPPSV